MSQPSKPNRIYGVASVFTAILFSITLVVVWINVHHHYKTLPIAVIVSAAFGLIFATVLTAWIRATLKHRRDIARKAATDAEYDRTHVRLIGKDGQIIR
jgi:apolipoprotein N-acyltransferase